MWLRLLARKLTRDDGIDNYIPGEYQERVRSKQHKILELFELLNNVGIGKAKNALVVLD